MLLQDFNTSNGNMQTEEIKDVTPHNSSKTTLKIILQQNEHADYAMAQGIRLRLVWIDLINITKQKDDEIRQCFKCFKFEHYTNQCERPLPICSICSGDHHFKNCPNPTIKKCVNCSGDQIAIARGCPTRRKELAQQINNAIPPHPIQPTAQANAPPNIHSTETFPPLRNPTTTNNNNTHTNNAPATDNSTTQKTTNPFMEHEWEITLKIAQTFAEMAARGDPNIYLEVMNEFLVSKGLQPMTLQRRSPAITKFNNTFFPPNITQKQHILHHTTLANTTWKHNTTAQA